MCAVLVSEENEEPIIIEDSKSGAALDRFFRVEFGAGFLSFLCIWSRLEGTIYPPDDMAQEPPSLRLSRPLQEHGVLAASSRTALVGSGPLSAGKTRKTSRFAFDGGWILLVFFGCHLPRQ